MKKQWFLSLLIILIPISIFGQRFSYYATDSTIKTGIKLVNEGHKINSKQCQVVKGDSILKFTPMEISEYGFKNGLTYKAFTINLNNQVIRYFLERLVEGKLNLYYLKLKRGINKYYVIENDSTPLMEIMDDKDQYSVFFNRITKDCPQAVNNIHFVKIQKFNLKRFVRDYNNCANRPFPTIHYGITMGTTVTQLSAVEKASIYSTTDFTFNSSISMGAFMDIPINTSNFSLHPEVNFKKIGMSKAFINEYTSYDLVINHSSISVPVYFRYCILSNRLSPFIQIGPVYSKAIRDNSNLIEYKSVMNEIFINVINSPVLQSNMGGFSIGSGIIIRNSWFGDIHFNKLFNLNQENKLLNSFEMIFKIGYSF